MKFVGVTQRLFMIKKQIFKDALDKDLVNFLNKIGYIAIPIPNIKLSNRSISKILNFFKNKIKIKVLYFLEVKI